MDILIIVSTVSAGAILKPLADACGRSGCNWAVFFTNDGVKLAVEDGVAGSLSSATSAVACHDSWTRFMADTDCPVSLGSQTNNSEFVGIAQRVISL